ncbi:MAG: restriction endonuclease subunit S [Proteobacteria bacterium]|nr:restriction endonuclease subunit S [Pseudomonadota bacterium]
MNRVSLQSISSIINSGLTPLRSNIEFWKGGNINWVKTEQLGIKNIYSSNEKITKKALENTSIKLNPKNTLSVAMYGEGQTRGRVSILRNETTTNQACCNLVINPSKADFEYVYYNLKTQYQNLRNLSSGVRNNLNSNDIKNFEISLPDLETQTQIAKVLSDLDAKIELNNKINQQLEAMAKTLYDYWFVQFGFPDANGNPYKSSGGKMVYDKKLKRETPEGWESGRLFDWIKNYKSGDWGKEHEQGNYTQKVSCVRGADLNGLNGKGNIKSPTRYILEKNIHKLLDINDLVIEMSGGSPTQSTGRLAFITRETLDRFNNPLICSNFCKAVTLKNSTYLYNFVYQWNRLYDAGVLFGWEGKTSGIKNLLFDSFVNNYNVGLPDSTVVEKFYKFTKTIHSKKQYNLLENKKLIKLRDWLLPMLMNGQVTVKQAQEEIQLNMAAEPPTKYKKRSRTNGKYK